MIITFVGHATISFKEKVKEAVKEQILAETSHVKHFTCYIGGYGDFDETCALACRELKMITDRFDVVYVTPYISLSEQEKINEMQACGLCDTSVYPPLESVPPRFAISKRNEWMVTNADLIVAYVSRSYGGAYKTLQMARRRKKRIINIWKFL